jgi:hypothetical protein
MPAIVPAKDAVAVGVVPIGVAVPPAEAANVPAVCGTVMRLWSDGADGVVMPLAVVVGVAAVTPGLGAVLSMLRAPPSDPPTVVAIRLPPS